jgi:hypothetical protein
VADSATEDIFHSFVPGQNFSQEFVVDKSIIDTAANQENVNFASNLS